MTRDLANRTTRGSRAHAIERFGEALERQLYDLRSPSLARTRTPPYPPGGGA